LENGRGVAKNLSEAVKYYKLSADQGNATAQSQYGYCLKNGKGIARDLVLAARYYNLAAKQRKEDARERLLVDTDFEPRLEPQPEEPELAAESDWEEMLDSDSQPEEPMDRADDEISAIFGTTVRDCLTIVDS
jgi:TPR repeat protein